MTYRAGIIGAGGIAGLGILGLHDEEAIGQKKFPESHAGGYHATEEIELVAVTDVNEEKLNAFGDAWEIPPDRRYVGHETMLESENLDVVSVCTPSFLHHDHVVDAAQSSTDPDVIWCEKPIASSVNEANEMSEVCAETHTELLINHSFRFTDKLQTLHDHIQYGLIGEVEAVIAQFRREMLRNSTHLIDTLVYLLDAQPRQVSGYLNAENDAVTALEGDREVDDSGGGGFVVTDDGTFVSLDCTVARDISSMTFQFIGTEGKLYLNNDDGEWRYWSLEDGTHVEKSIPGIDDAWRWDEDYRDSFANAAEHVADLLDGDTENHSTGEEATRSVEVIVGFYISHYTGGHVNVPFDRPLRDVTITSW